MNHRLFCVLDRDADDLGGSIVVIDGLSKPKRSAADSRDYRRALAYRAEFYAAAPCWRIGSAGAPCRRCGTSSRPSASASAGAC